MSNQEERRRDDSQPQPDSCESPDKKIDGGQSGSDPFADAKPAFGRITPADEAEWAEHLKRQEYDDTAAMIRAIADGDGDLERGQVMHQHGKDKRMVILLLLEAMYYHDEPTSLTFDDALESVRPGVGSHFSDEDVREVYSEIRAKFNFPEL